MRADVVRAGGAARLLFENAPGGPFTGGTGRLVIEHERGVIVRLTVIFDDE